MGLPNSAPAHSPNGAKNTVAIIAVSVTVGLGLLGYLTELNDRIGKTCNATVGLAQQQRTVLAVAIERSRSVEDRDTLVRLLNESTVPEC